VRSIEYNEESDVQGKKLLRDAVEDVLLYGVRAVGIFRLCIEYFSREALMIGSELRTTYLLESSPAALE
jgi:hypothetical protein